MSAELPSPSAHAKAESSSLGELLGEATRDMSTLMRQEVALAKVELKDSAARAGKGGVMLAGAGIAGHFVFFFLSLALWWALGTWWGLGWSGVVVAVIWAVIAAILALVGRKEIKAVKGLPQTGQTLQKIPPTLKPNT